MELLHTFFQKIPMAALFLSVAIGYWIGKIQIGKFQLGGMAGTLLAAVVIGQVGVPVDAEVKSIMFALFIYATGYVSGPQFFASLNRKTVNQLHLALISAVTVFAFIFIVVKVMGFDKGTAAGLLAGATTESASIGTAGEALHRLGLAADKVKVLAANIGVTYAITYLFGMLTAYVLARRFVFDASGRSVRSELYRFTLVNLVALAQVWLVSVGLAEWLFPAIDFQWHAYDIAHLIGVASPIVTSYLGHRYYSFRLLD